MCRYGKVALSTTIPMLSIGILHRFATPLYKGRVACGNVAGGNQSTLMAIPTRVYICDTELHLLNTSATPISLRD